MIKLTERAWQDLRQKLMREHPKSTMLLREKRRQVLGFTERYHYVYLHEQPAQIEIHLDFYDDAKETWFRMKYL